MLAPAQPTIAANDAGLDRALRRVSVALALFVAAFGVGVRWDRAWHPTHPFEDFWSPPHLFIYSMFLVLTLARTAVTPELCRWFGDGFPVPGLLYQLPGSLALALGGVATVGLAGILDSI